LKRSKFTDDL